MVMSSITEWSSDGRVLEREGSVESVLRRICVLVREVSDAVRF